MAPQAPSPNGKEGDPHTESGCRSPEPPRKRNGSTSRKLRVRANVDYRLGAHGSVIVAMEWVALAAAASVAAKMQLVRLPGLVLIELSV